MALLAHLAALALLAMLCCGPVAGFGGPQPRPRQTRPTGLRRSGSALVYVGLASLGRLATVAAEAHKGGHKGGLPLPGASSGPPGAGPGRGKSFGQPNDASDAGSGKGSGGASPLHSSFGRMPTVRTHNGETLGQSLLRNGAHRVDLDAALPELKDQTYLTVVADCELPTGRGGFRMRSYRWHSPDGRTLMEPVAIFRDDAFHAGGEEPTYVRIHDQCFTSEVFGSRRCDCREQLEMTLDFIQENGGVIVYLPQEGRGIGLANKVAAYELQDQGLDTVDANHRLGFPDDMRSYDMVPGILEDFEIKAVRLLTNNPFKVRSLLGLGVDVVQTTPVLATPNAHNVGYLKTKAKRMNHSFKFRTNKTNGESELAPNTENMPVPRMRGGAPIDADSPTSAPAKVIIEKGASASLEPVRDARWVFGRESVEQALEDMRQGKPVVVVDDEDRENEGDLILAAEHANAENIGFFVRYTSGVICVALEKDRLDALDLPQMVMKNEDPKATAFTVTVDAKEDVSTGISAGDRAVTLRKLASASAKAEDFCRPGHIFPLQARKGGVRVRQGHTEASVDLARLAGCEPAGVLCEITTADAQGMARLPELREFAAEHGLVVTSIEDILMYRVEMDR